jgi:hypothetical protein
MKRLAIPFVCLLVAFVAACTSGPKISAKEMKHQLETGVYEFNQDLNAADIDGAKSFVAPQAEKAFAKLVEGYRAGTYNMFETGDLPAIDYIGNKATVKMTLFKGQGGAITGAKEVETQLHDWVYVNGGWQWAGPASR